MSIDIFDLLARADQLVIEGSGVEDWRPLFAQGLAVATVIVILAIIVGLTLRGPRS